MKLKKDGIYQEKSSLRLIVVTGLLSDSVNYDWLYNKQHANSLRKNFVKRFRDWIKPGPAAE
jgi:hypothetical protein